MSQQDPGRYVFQFAALRAEMAMFIRDRAEAARYEIQQSIEHARRCNGQRFRRLRERLEVDHGQFK